LPTEQLACLRTGEAHLFSSRTCLEQLSVFHSSGKAKGSGRRAPSEQGGHADDDGTADDRSRTDVWYALSLRPETQPAYDLLAVDDRARLWVRAWSASGLSTNWWVFAESGELLGSVSVPSGMKITSVSCPCVWGIELGDLDVSSVVRYAVRGTDTC